MAKEIGKIRKELARVRQDLARIEYRISYVELELKKPSEDERLKTLEAELREQYPNIRVDRSFLRLVGTQPYNPPERDKEIIREAVAGRYG